MGRVGLRSCGALVVLVACATGVTALAANGYSVRLSTTSPVVSAQPFSIKARGDVKQKALMYVYLDRQACPPGSNKAAARDGVYKLGESYFLQKRGGQQVKESWIYAWVSGSFEKSLTAYAGSVDGREHACAYLDRANKYGGYRVTTARASAHYTVTQ